MTDFNVRDLASAVGFAAVTYALFNLLISFGSGRPLAEWINPHRRYLLSLTAVLLVAAFGLLERAALKYQASSVTLLEALVREERAKPEVVGAVSFAVFGAAMIGLFVYCHLFHPRAPTTFSPNAADLKAECRRAMRHYLRWSRRLDYAALFTVADGRAAKSVGYSLPAKVLSARMRRVESMNVADDVPPAQAADEQLARWDDLAARCFARWGDLDALVAPARQGDNVLLLFDLQFGGVFVELMQEYSAADGTRSRVFLFVVCLDQAGLDSAEATRFYTLLARAVRHIRTGSGKARG